MRKGITYLMCAITYTLITFFGLFPVVFADGTIKERLATLIIVLLLYVINTIVLKKLISKWKR